MIVTQNRVMSATAHEAITVLHVDEDQDFTGITRTFLERENDRFTVETAPSADEGLDILADRPPDCVVSDYKMPGMDGLDTIGQNG
jgi:CheY-like chemotaxis protein